MNHNFFIKRIARTLGVIFLMLVSIVAFSQAPEGYYDDTDGVYGEDLQQALHEIIRNHTRFSYEQVKDFIEVADADPANEGRIILFYSDRSELASNIGSSGDTWNREHIWAKSHGFPEESDTAYTDFHHLRPSDASVNSSRSNKDFNNVEHTAGNEEGEAADTYTNDDYWEPRDAIKGDVARMMFYMATRYNSASLDLELVDRLSLSGRPEFGVLYTLLEWHEQDPVSQEEIDRNNIVFEWQGNRNPFVDHPEWVSSIWGNVALPLLFGNTANFNPDFGFVPIGSSKVQQYSLNSYNLMGGITVEASGAFEVSLDNENWTQYLEIPQEGLDQSNTIYMKFTPTSEGEEYSANIVHSTMMSNYQLRVTGQEGEIEVLSIAEAREVPVGESVSIAGVVIDRGNNNDDNRVIYDGTAGIVVRSFDPGNESEQYEEGDSILVSGILSSYNNLLQISESPITIELLKSGAAIPEAQVLTISEIGENEESELVKIEGVEFITSGTFQSGNSAFTDGSNNFTFRIGGSTHPLIGMEIPIGKVDIVGIIGQFENDYQISARDEFDIIEVEEPLTTGLGDELDDRISIYPNPVTNDLYLQSDLASSYSYVLSDMNGNKVLASNNVDGTNILDVSTVSRGMYFLTLTDDKGSHTYKVIKQ
ncbi:endonuclease [Fulvivirga maritima]|uniref:endonuclease n=1 Tax=Fulvivirga maritima TaxID=2904247 RepID=UPI001F157430|nr:endonuclease [Fulvivirga maritima]UII27856.1 endonuclease [Fulvivirga maritima]